MTDIRAADMLPTIKALQSSGMITRATGIARAVNEQGMPTRLLHRPHACKNLARPAMRCTISKLREDAHPLT